LAGWAVIQAAPAVAQAKDKVAAGQAGSVVSAKDSMAPHSARFTSFFAGLGDVQVHGDAAVFVGLNGDGLDTARPPLKCVFIEVAGPVIWMDARSVEDFRAEVIAQTSKTSLVEHECCTLLSVDALGLQVSEQVIGRYVFVEDIWSEASEKGMAVFFGGGQEHDIGGRPEPYGVFVGDEGCSQASPRAWVRGLEVDRPSAVELVVAVHGVAAAESDEHGFGSACDAQDFMTENQRIGLCEGRKGPLTVLNDLANQRLSDFVGGATDLWALWHDACFSHLVLKTCLRFRQAGFTQ